MTTTPDNLLTNLAERACAVAWGPRPRRIPVVAAPIMAESTEADDRLLRLTALMGEHMRIVAPQMSREDALQLSCLIVDITLAVHAQRKFIPGVLRRTPGVAEMSLQATRGLIERHCRGDWGDLSDKDREANEVALTGNGRLLSCYTDVHDGPRFWTKVWVMTDPSIVATEGPASRLRSTTLVLLPSEY